MPNVRANGIQIEYDTFGDKSSPALIMIMGLASQMIAWDEEFCQRLADKGHYVIRFDNRDIGLSTKFTKVRLPDMKQVATAFVEREIIDSPYSLDDMADDTVGLMDALNIDKAHICGASMGGMIAQVVAYRHPKRVLSLTSIMSTTGAPGLPKPKPEALAVMFGATPSEREANIENTVVTWKTIGSPGFPFDEERVRRNAARTFDRSYNPLGAARQILAVAGHKDRTSALGAVKIPTLVIHGADDILVPVEGGKATAAAIPGAELLIIDGMGHDFPVETWEPIVNAITKNTNKA